ncbi:MAG: hypothetical protein N3A57_08240, partial [Negativicutes bacterium]|nr:hypothetical protein [Negativicutes bacterium]
RDRNSLGQNLGPVRAYNHAYNEACRQGYDYAVFLNDDSTILDDHWQDILEESVAAYQLKIGVFADRQLDGNGEHGWLFWGYPPSVVPSLNFFVIKCGLTNVLLDDRFVRGCDDELALRLNASGVDFHLLPCRVEHWDAEDNIHLSEQNCDQISYLEQILADNYAGYRQWRSECGVKGWLPMVDRIVELKAGRVEKSLQLQYWRKVNLFRQSAADKAKLFIFGAGSEGEEAAIWLEEIGLEYDGFVDNDPGKVGKTKRKAKIYSPEALYDDCTVLVATDGRRDVIEQIRSISPQINCFDMSAFRYWSSIQKHMVPQDFTECVSNTVRTAMFEINRRLNFVAY